MAHATHLDSSNLNPRGVPPLALPPLDTHRAQAEQADRAVALAHLDAVHDGRGERLVRVLGVDERLARERHVERRARRRAVRAARRVRLRADRVRVVRPDVVVFVLLLRVPVRALEAAAAAAGNECIRDRDRDWGGGDLPLWACRGRRRSIFSWTVRMAACDPDDEKV